MNERKCYIATRARYKRVRLWFGDCTRYKRSQVLYGNPRPFKTGAAVVWRLHRHKQTKLK